jgi:hypothetical protein
MFDITISCDFKKNISKSEALNALRMISGIHEMLRKQINALCGTYITMAFTIDDFTLYPNISNEKFNKHNIDLFNVIMGNKEEKPDNTYIKNALSSFQNASNDLFNIPENILKFFKKIDGFSLKYPAEMRLTIKADKENKIIEAFTPENLSVGQNKVSYIIASLMKMVSTVPDFKDYTIQFSVYGSIAVMKDLKWLGKHCDKLVYAHEIITVQTPFKLLDKELLPFTKVDKIVMNYPMLNTVGGDHQKAQIFPQRWKSPDVEITANGYDIAREDDSFRYYIYADKKTDA